VVGDANDLRTADWSKDTRVELYASDAGIYGLMEQALALSGAFRGAALLWVPHYSLPLLYRGRLVVTIHDVCHLPESLNSNIKRMYARLLFSNAARRADAILCDSEFTSLEVQRFLRVRASKIHVAHLGLDATWDARATPHVEPNAVPYFLFVGNLKPNKNLSTLVKAFRLVMGDIPHRLVIVGKAENMKIVDQSAVGEAEKLYSRVHLAGEISDQRLVEYYRGAEALVFPSLYEGFGLPPLEAMSLGCPVLCSNASSLPEIAGDAALYFDPRDPDDLAAKLLRITQASELRSHLVQKGLDRVGMFSYKTCARQTADVLNRILSEGNNS